MFVTASPAPVKAALKMLGHDSAPLRLPLVECDETERTHVHDVLARHGVLAGGSRRVERQTPRPPAGGRRRDRQEHDGRRVRRPDRRRRLRPALPDGRDDGHRPRPAGLHVPARQRRRDRGDRDHPRPRGPPRRAAVGDPRPRPGQDPGRLQRPADDRDGALEARRAQAARRPPRRAADRRRRPGRPVRDRADPSDALDPGLERHRAHHAARHRPVHRRLQVRPDAGGRRAGRHVAARRARPRGAAAALRRLHERRSRGDLGERVARRPAPGPRVRPLQGPHRRHLLRVEHPPRPAGRARGGDQRPQGRARRALDAQERQHRPQPRPHRHPGGDAGAAARDRPVGRREDRRDLDRLPGRAAVGAAPDGLPRPPAGGAEVGRHRGVQRHADPRQRARGQRDDRPPVPHRLRGDHRPRRADPRLRPRLRGGGQDDDQPHAPEAT